MACVPNTSSLINCLKWFPSGHWALESRGESIDPDFVKKHVRVDYQWLASSLSYALLYKSIWSHTCNPFIYILSFIMAFYEEWDLMQMWITVTKNEAPKWFCDMSGQSTFGFLKTFGNINHLKWMRELPFSIGKLILKLGVIKFFMSLFRCCCSCCPPQKSRGKQAMHNLWEESCFCCSSQAAGDVSFISTGGTRSSSGGRRIKKRKRALFVLGETGILQYLRVKFWRSRMVHKMIHLRI